MAEAGAEAAEVPELRHAGLPRGETLESFRTLHGARIGAAPPYWAVAWPGGQALARYLLDHPGLVRGRRVLDVGCGAGLCAVAALLAGARSACAADSDPLALCAARVCAALNGVEVATLRSDFAALAGLTDPGDVICAGDLWYDRAVGRAASVALAALARRGHLVLIGDGLRAARPRAGVRELARYRLAEPAEFGRHDRQEAMVARFDIPCCGPSCDLS